MGRPGAPGRPAAYVPLWTELAREREWSPRRLAVDLGSPYTTVWAWSRGKTEMPRGAVERLATLAFACSVPIPASGWVWLIEKARLHDLAAVVDAAERALASSAVEGN